MKHMTTLNIDIEAKPRAKFNAYFDDNLIVEQSAGHFELLRFSGPIGMTMVLDMV